MRINSDDHSCQIVTDHLPTCALGVRKELIPRTPFCRHRTLANHRPKIKAGRVAGVGRRCFADKSTSGRCEPITADLVELSFHLSPYLISPTVGIVALECIAVISEPIEKTAVHLHREYQVHCTVMPSPGASLCCHSLTIYRTERGLVFLTICEGYARQERCGGNDNRQNLADFHFDTFLWLVIDVKHSTRKRRACQPKGEERASEALSLVQDGCCPVRQSGAALKRPGASSSYNR